MWRTQLCTPTPLRAADLQVREDASRDAEKLRRRVPGVRRAYCWDQQASSPPKSQSQSSFPRNEVPSQAARYYAGWTFFCWTIAFKEKWNDSNNDYYCIRVEMKIKNYYGRFNQMLCLNLKYKIF